MLRHLIIEGCDGSGKDTLIIDLMGKFQGRYVLHERASTSLGGPVDDLAGWVARDVNTMHEQPPSIYNRHPLISEPIYGRYRDLIGKETPKEFKYQPWMYAMKRHAAQHAILILCRPPWDQVKNVVVRQGAKAHMPGVLTNLALIYLEYRKVVWPGAMLVYDYTRHTPDDLITRIENMMQMHKKASS